MWSSVVNHLSFLHPKVVFSFQVCFLQVRVLKSVPWLVVENDESLKTLNNQMQGGDIGSSKSSC